MNSKHITSLTRADLITAKIQALLGFACGGIIFYTIYQNIHLITESMTADDQWTIIITFFLVFFLILLLMHIKTHSQKILCALVILSIVLRALSAYIPQTPPSSDFYVLYDAAERVLSDDYSWLQTTYFQRWSYQIPFVIFQSLLLRISHSILIIKSLNVVFMAVTNIMIYMITRRFTSDRCALIVFFLYMIYPEQMLLASVLTNQHGATAFLLIAIYFLIRVDHWKWAIYAGIFCVLGNMFRPEGPVILLAGVFIGIVALIQFWVCRSRKGAVLARNMAVFLLVYFLISGSASGIAKLSGFSETGFCNNYPQWKVVTGLNPVNSGRYTAMDSHIFSIKDDRERWSETLRIVGKYLKETDKTLFIEKKTEVMWAERESYAWSCFHMDMSRVVFYSFTVEDIMNQMINVDKGIYMAVWTLMFLFMMQLCYMRREGKITILLFPAIFFINYCVYLVFEIQTRYRYFIMPFIFIMAGLALGDILNPTASTQIKNEQ